MHRNNSKKPRIINNSDKIILALEDFVFSVGLRRDGTTFHVEKRKIEEVVPSIKKALKRKNILWLDYVVSGDFKKQVLKSARLLGFSELLVKNLLKATRGNYEDLETEMGILLPAMRVEGFDVKINPLLVLIRENLIVTMHTAEVTRFFRLRKYAATLLRKFPKDMSNKDKITMLLIRIIDENNARNFDYLRVIEEHGDKLSARLADPKASRALISKQIHDMKHALVTYLDGLWATIDVLSALRYGDADLLTDDIKIIERINALSVEVNAQIGLAEHMSEVLASGLEVMQTIYNNQLQMLNNKLALLVAYLTILGTAVLVPNTLATILSNPAYGLGPDDMWWYSGLMIVSTVFATVVAYWWVKKMGWLEALPE
ncbi:MAG: CorA family divalent cation transporter [Candidatus Anstonellales archaeon]